MKESNFSEEDAKKYEWELCRENVRPAKHGRRVNAINKALSHVACNAEKEATAKLDEYLEQAERSEDPLLKCLDFCVWFEESYPSGKQHLFYTLLWKIIHKYIQNERYQGDPRTLRIWERLADNSMGHGYEIYQHAHQHGCLLESADFHIRWARELEDCGSISAARDVLHKGRLQGAVPLNILEEEEDQLEMREMRRQLDRAQINPEDNSDEEEESESRQVFTRVRSFDDGAVPVIRLPSVVGEQGPRTLNVQKTQVKQVAFEVLEDEEKDQEGYLESIYAIHNDAHTSHINRYTLKDNNNTITKLVSNADHAKKFSAPGSSFTVWDDDKENVDPNETKQNVSKPIAAKTATAKPKLAFKKELLYVAMEETLVEEYLADMAVRRKLNFDED